MLFKQLKKDIVQAMKDQDALRRDLLRTLVGDCSKATKEPSDTECVTIIKEFIKNAEGTLRILKEKGINVFAAAGSKQMKEIIILESYLPKQMDENEIRLIIAACLLTGCVGVGPIMKHFKENFENRYDGKLVSSIAKEL